MLFFKKIFSLKTMVVCLGLLLASISFAGTHPAFFPKNNEATRDVDSTETPFFKKITFPKTKGSRMSHADMAQVGGQIQSAFVQYALSADSLDMEGVRTAKAHLLGTSATHNKGKAILTGLQADETMYARWVLTYNNPQGERLSVKAEIESFVVPKPLVIATIGDSNASGEGNPLVQDADTAKVVWSTGKDADDCQLCHRSDLAGPTQGIRQLQEAGWAIRYVSFACSGANMCQNEGKGNQLMHPWKPYHASKNAKMGLKEARVFKNETQIELVKEWLGDDDLDILLMSIGANDSGFLPVLTKCVVGTTPVARRIFKKKGLAKKMAKNFERVEQMYSDLDTVIRQTLKPKHIIMTTYANASTNENGDWCHEYIDPNYECPPDAKLSSGCKLLSRIQSEDNKWLNKSLLTPLNSIIHKAAQKHGWHLTEGLSSSDTTGVCSKYKWFRTIAESMHTQGDRKAALHLNNKGHEVYGNLMFRELMYRIGADETLPSAPTPFDAKPDGGVITDDDE